MEFMKQKWSSGLVVGLVFAALVIGGCAKGDAGSTASSVTNPSAVTFQPKGTIQGKVRDSVTLQPIVNAVVSIGLSVDVTDAQGQYILANVPATQDALNGTISGHYDMTVDLRQVNSPVNMVAAASATNPHYPQFTYRDKSVEFTSLNDTSCNNDNNDNSTSDTCTTTSNHDTPVDGLATNADVFVGKLDATIQGVVAGCSFAAGDFYTPQAGAVVNLVSNGSENSTTGSSGHVVATTTTDAAGAFTFANIEANQDFEIEATDSAVPPTAEGSKSVTSPSDGQILYLRVQESTAVHICPVDSHGPTIIAVTPEPGSDLTPGAQDVVITFSEPVAQNAQTSTDPSSQGGLITSGNLQAEFLGNKGSVPFSAAWNATFDQLTVSLSNGTGSSGLYVVGLNVSQLNDAVGNGADPGMCPGAAPSPWNIGFGPSQCYVYFSTNGGAVPGTTANLTVTNASSLDVGSETALLDWPVISGAKSYNLYCQQSQVYQDGSTQAGTFQFVRNVSASQDNPDFFGLFGGFDGPGNEHSLQYSCLVRGVNSDGAEGADSNIVTVKDGVGPDFTANGTNGSPTVTVNFTEPVKESEAETLTNYALSGTDAALTLQSVVYNTATGQATLTYSANITDDVGDTLTITNVHDLAGNANLTTPAGNNQDTL